MRKALLLLLVISSGCAAAEGLFATKLDTPPEFQQKVILEVSDDYKQFQAPRSGYDIGDLQSFHTQHTLPVTVKDAFDQLFGEVELKKADGEAGIEAAPPDVPAVFEVRIADLAHDYWMDAEEYRSELTLGVAMKSPNGNIYWRKAFRGSGYVKIDNQFSMGLGPQDAVLDALRDALDQMQKAIIASPEVRLQMRHYQESDQARRPQDTTDNTP